MSRTTRRINHYASRGDFNWTLKPSNLGGRVELGGTGNCDTPTLRPQAQCHSDWSDWSGTVQAGRLSLEASDSDSNSRSPSESELKIAQRFGLASATESWGGRCTVVVFTSHIPAVSRWHAGCINFKFPMPRTRNLKPDVLSRFTRPSH